VRAHRLPRATPCARDAARARPAPQVYALLKRQQQAQQAQAAGRRDHAPPADDAELQAAIARIVGAERLSYWPLVDQLLFCEELSQQQQSDLGVELGQERTLSAKMVEDMF
jgi:hypothetical protein